MHVSRKVVMINNTTAYNAPSPGSSTPGSGEECQGGSDGILGGMQVSTLNLQL